MSTTVGLWHRRHQTVDTAKPSEAPEIMPGRKLPIVGFSWDEMWRLLKSQPPTAAGTATNVVVPGTTRSQDLLAASAIRDRRPHKAHDLGAVGQGRSAALLNVCLDRNYQERDSNIALMADPAIGRLYLDRNRDKAGPSSSSPSKITRANLLLGSAGSVPMSSRIPQEN